MLPVKSTHTHTRHRHPKQDGNHHSLGRQPALPGRSFYMLPLPLYFSGCSATLRNDARPWTRKFGGGGGQQQCRNKTKTRARKRPENRGAFAQTPIAVGCVYVCVCVSVDLCVYGKSCVESDYDSASVRACVCLPLSIVVRMHVGTNIVYYRIYRPYIDIAK